MERFEYKQAAGITALSASIADFTYKSTATRSTRSASPSAAFSSTTWKGACSPPTAAV